MQRKQLLSPVYFLNWLLCLFWYWNNVIVLSTVYSTDFKVPLENEMATSIRNQVEYFSVRLLVQVIILWVLKVLAEKKVLPSLQGLVRGNTIRAVEPVPHQGTGCTWKG